MLITKPRLPYRKNPLFWMGFAIGCAAVSYFARSNELFLTGWLIVTMLASANFGATCVRYEILNDQQPLVRSDK